MSRAPRDLYRRERALARRLGGPVAGLDEVFVQKYANGLWQNWLSQEGLDKHMKQVQIDFET